MKYKGSGDEGLLGSGVLLFEFLFFQFVLGEASGSQRTAAFLIQDRLWPMSREVGS